MEPSFNELEQKIGYRFNDLSVLEESLSHSSLRQHKKQYKFDYEKLEFFGDSILSFVITEKLYSEYTSLNEGELAKFRNYLISKDIIVEAANTIHLSQYIIMTDGEENAGGRSNVNNIENAMEALLAAIYVDSHYQIHHARSLILKLWHRFFDLYDEPEADPKGYLQAYSQSLGFPPPKYKIISQMGESHTVEFTCEVSLQSGEKSTGKGFSIKSSQKVAAKNLIKLLEI